MAQAHVLTNWGLAEHRKPPLTISQTTTDHVSLQYSNFLHTNNSHPIFRRSFYSLEPCTKWQATWDFYPNNKSYKLSASQIQLWCWQCAPYKCL